jgi:chromosome segregation ATPase
VERDEGAGREEGSGLQLEVMEEDAPEAAAPAAGPTEIARDEVKDLGGFGPPPAGLVETVRYGFRVSARLSALAAQRRKAEETRSRDDERRLVLLAELGRMTHEHGLASASAESKVSHALRLEQNLGGALKRRDGLTHEHNESLRKLAGEMREVEILMAPAREREVAATLRLDAVRADQRRAEGKLKRAEIELRNVTELIEKRQKQFADLSRPREERDRLLKEIADLDLSQPEMHARIKAGVDALEELREPMAQAQAAADQVNLELAGLGERLGGLRKERERLERTFSQAADNVDRVVEEDRREARNAWATVGEQVVAEGTHLAAPLARKGEVVAAAVETAAASARKLEVIARASEAYDHDAYRKAKMMGVGAVAGVLVLATVVITILVI